MTPSSPLKFLMPGWFSMVMGLSGLSLAWHRASGVLGEMADGIALVVGALAALVFVLLLVASFVRASRYPAALADDLKHPVRHAFVAALPVSTLLLAAVGVALLGAHPLLHALWWVGALTQVWATVWVLGRWLSPVIGTTPGNTGLWPAVTPVLLIPVVGNVVAPLAGLPLGHDVWSAAQMGIGVFFWPIVMGLVLVRRIAHSPLPDRILPAWFITLAPPAVIGVVLTQFEAPAALPLGMWGIAVFTLMWLTPLVRRIASQPFGVAFWGLSFPMASLAALTLRLGELQGGGALQTVGVLLLAVASMVILWLGFATVRGLRDGTLLAPEPIASIQPVAA
ncbi:SLAC1 anion channel family protein [Hydrogenophaga sp. PAMC20947]|uniref:SLAC1 anion channel family protein n=1 Tax=Hydrogenophaga sp. PAMC20947 TaxID=2565558 RepID=UPI00109D90BB|nr:SLAC1 anion channel family protein [Hydrogenophaga sp. PAMC20947]QCB47476.1 C4-dicarboxylate ABC transporter [Hydrogenophaga sp. PAMC20947]